MEFREHEEHFGELVLPLLMRGDLTFGDLLRDDLEDLIAEDDLLPEELRVPFAASGAATNAKSKAAVMIHRAAFFIWIVVRLYSVVREYQ